MKKVTAWLLLFAGSCCLAIGLAEVGLRVAGISYPSFYDYNDVKGTALRPGAEGWWFKENRNYVRINKDGRRDVARPVKKNENTIRIAVIGDSYAEAFQVPIEKTFWKGMERRLNSGGCFSGKRVEVLNFGVSGYGTTQEYLTLQNDVFAYSPDMVLMAFYPGNDVRNNSYDLERNPDKPYFVMEDGRMRLDQGYKERLGPRSRSFKARIVRRLINISRVVQLVIFAKESYKARRMAADTEPAPKPAVDNRTKAEPPLGVDDKIFIEPVEEKWKKAWSVTEKVISMTRDETLRNGAKFFLVVISVPIQAHPDRGKRESYRKRLEVEDLFYPGRRLAKYGAETGIPVLDLSPVMQKYAQTHNEYLHGFNGKGKGHWNERGHQVAGKAISEWICDHAGSGKLSGSPKQSISAS